jgi:hypothetical protein
VILRTGHLRTSFLVYLDTFAQRSRQKCVGADPGTNHRVENLWRCSLHRRGRSAARGPTVRDLAQGSGSLPDGLDGPRVHRGGRVRRRCLNFALGRDPVGEERFLVLSRVSRPP